jgi:AAA15 family ATPase/GTPase
MVGKNNAGKSTLIEALRILSVVLNRAKGLHFIPAPSWVEDSSLYGISPSIDNLNISTFNIFYLYGEPPAKISGYFDDGTEIQVFLGIDADIFVVIYDKDKSMLQNKKCSII